MTAVRWRKSSEHSVAAVGADYAVSRATVFDKDAHTLVDRFSAWYGPDMMDQEIKIRRPAELLGIRPTAAEAKTLCAEHLASRGAPPELDP